MNGIRTSGQIILICLLVPLNVGNSDIIMGKMNGAFVDIIGNAVHPVDHHGSTGFGLVEAAKAQQHHCGRKDYADRDELSTICVANLYHRSNMPKILDHPNNIGYHTIFEVVCERVWYTQYSSLQNYTPNRRLRFINQIESDSMAPANGYLFAVSEEFFEYCVNQGSEQDLFNSNGQFFMSHQFFTDFKLHVGSGLKTNPCPNPTANSNKLSVYFALTDSQNCDREYKGYFGIRVKPHGSNGVYKSVEVSITPKGSYGDVSIDKDHFYYIEESDLRPLFEAAKCTIVCKHKTSNTSYCKVHTFCGADFVSMHYDGSKTFPNLIADYAYLRQSSEVSICRELHTLDTVAYATPNIIFDERLNGQLRCDCANEYGWNILIQACQPCADDSTLRGCTDNIPDPVEACNPDYTWDAKRNTCVLADHTLCLC